MVRRGRRGQCVLAARTGVESAFAGAPRTATSAPRQAAGEHPLGGSQHVDSIADNLLAVDALLFVGACFLAYLALRARQTRRARGLERVADVVFLGALAMMVGIGMLVAYEII